MQNFQDKSNNWVTTKIPNIFDKIKNCEGVVLQYEGTETNQGGVAKQWITPRTEYDLPMVYSFARVGEGVHGGVIVKSTKDLILKIPKFYNDAAVIIDEKDHLLIREIKDSSDNVLFPESEMEITGIAHEPMLIRVQCTKID